MRRLAVAQALACAYLLGQAGPYERQKVNPAAAQRGQRIYTQYCINCHGALAKGTDDGPDLTRSPLVLRDRLGDQIGPALKKLANHKADFTQAQVADITHFLKDRIETTAKDRNAAKPPDVLTGNADAGKAYFNGAGKCNTCHSPAGDLAGIGRRYNPLAMQQRFLFPRSGGRGTPPIRPAEVTVTPPSGAPVSGTLDHIDDFDVSLRDASGAYHSWHRTAGLKVEVHDPYAAHNELLDQYTNADMHNLVAYLESLK
jgi:mono/diheme cytochrome c family protein